MRAVLDTNVIVSGTLSATGASRALLNLVRSGELDTVTSVVLLDELEEVLSRFFSLASSAEIRVAFEEVAYIVEPGQIPVRVRDPDDDYVLAAAVTGEARYIITRDKDLLALETHEGIPILEPAPALWAIRAVLGSGLNLPPNRQSAPE